MAENSEEWWQREKKQWQWLLQRKDEVIKECHRLMAKQSILLRKLELEAASKAAMKPMKAMKAMKSVKAMKPMKALKAMNSVKAAKAKKAAF